MRQHDKVSEVTEEKTVVYVDDQYRIPIRQLARSWLWHSELPTRLLIVTIYGGWFACVAGRQTLGLTLATLLLIWFTTWYMSLQHEPIHGHPTRLAWFNQLLGTLPSAVRYPYSIHRDSHLVHYRSRLLTRPEDDPESYYAAAESWQRFPTWQHRFIHLRNTSWRHLLLAPLMDIIHTLNHALRAFHGGDRRVVAMWSLHLLLLTGLLTWITAQGFSSLWFVLAVDYLALALTKVRSFLEHHAADDPLARSVISETGLPWRVLLLNLNYHAVHHDLPGVPWYALRQLYLHCQTAYPQRNQGLPVCEYGEWRCHFGCRAAAVNAHPGFSEQAQAGGEYG